MSTLTATVYRWEAKRPNATQQQSLDVRTTFMPIYPNLASVNLALVGNAFVAMGADTRLKQRIRRDVRYTLAVAPRWREQKTSGAVQLDGVTLTVPFGSQVLQRDLRTVDQWAVHPRSGAGVVLRFSEAEGFIRIKSDEEGTQDLVASLTRFASTRRVTWTPEPIDHPAPRWLIDASFKPSGGLMSLVVHLAVLAIMLVFPIFWPAFAIAGLYTLVECSRNFDTFKPGLRTWVMLAWPVMGFFALTALAS